MFKPRTPLYVLSGLDKPRRSLIHLDLVGLGWERSIGVLEAPGSEMRSAKCDRSLGQVNHFGSESGF